MPKETQLSRVQVLNHFDTLAVREGAQGMKGAKNNVWKVSSALNKKKKKRGGSHSGALLFLLPKLIQKSFLPFYYLIVLWSEISEILVKYKCLFKDLVKKK